MAAAHSNRAYRRFEDVDWANWIPQQRATLLFVICHGHMLLIHKKRGLGVGKTIGPGGRLAPGESALRGALYVRYKRNSALHLLARSSVVSLPFSSRMAFLCLSMFSQQPAAQANRRTPMRPHRCGFLSIRFRTTRCGPMTEFGFRSCSSGRHSMADPCLTGILCSVMN
jgi:hypothetical protein